MKTGFPIILTPILTPGGPVDTGVKTLLRFAKNTSDSFNRFERDLLGEAVDFIRPNRVVNRKELDAKGDSLYNEALKAKAEINDSRRKAAFHTAGMFLPAVSKGIKYATKSAKAINPKTLNVAKTLYDTPSDLWSAYKAVKSEDLGDTFNNGVQAGAGTLELVTEGADYVVDAPDPSRIRGKVKGLIQSTKMQNKINKALKVLSPLDDAISLNSEIQEATDPNLWNSVKNFESYYRKKYNVPWWNSVDYNRDDENEALKQRRLNSDDVIVKGIYNLFYGK